MLTEDCTQEAMALLMQHNKERLFSFSSDARKAVDNLEGLYNRLSAPEDSLFVRGFSGDPCTVHRVSRAAITLEHPCLTVLWFVQPDVFHRMLGNDRLRKGGFLARVLVCDTHLEPREQNDDTQTIPLDVSTQYNTLINRLIVTYWETAKPLPIPITKEGQKLFRVYHNELVPARKNDKADISSFLARWPEQARRLAIGLHAALHGETCHTVSMSVQTIEHAIRLARWFAAEQLRMLETSRREMLLQQMRFLRDLLIEQYPNGTTARTLRKSHNLPEEHLNRMIKEFPATFEFKDHKPSKAGRPTQIFCLKPNR